MRSDFCVHNDLVVDVVKQRDHEVVPTLVYQDGHFVAQGFHSIRAIPSGRRIYGGTVLESAKSIKRLIASCSEACSLGAERWQVSVTDQRSEDLQRMAGRDLQAASRCMSPESTSTPRFTQGLRPIPTQLLRERMGKGYMQRNE